MAALSNHTESKLRFVFEVPYPSTVIGTDVDAAGTGKSVARPGRNVTDLYVLANWAAVSYHHRQEKRKEIPIDTENIR